MILYLDTTKPKTTISLFSFEKEKIISKSWLSESNQSEELLEEIDKLLARAKQNKREIRLVVANPGPGSYTGIRIGLTTANLLGFSLNIPVISKSMFDSADKRELSDLKNFSSPLLPVYLAPPVITKPKARR